MAPSPAPPARPAAGSHPASALAWPVTQVQIPGAFMSSLPGQEETEITVRTRQDGSLPVWHSPEVPPQCDTPTRWGQRQAGGLGP